MSDRQEQGGKTDARLVQIKKEIELSQKRIGKLEGEKGELTKKIKQMEVLVSSTEEQEKSNNEKFMKMKIPFGLGL